MARSRFPLAVARSQLASNAWTSVAASRRGTVVSFQPGTGGTPSPRGVVIIACRYKKRSSDRSSATRPCSDLAESPRDASASKNAVTACSLRPSTPAGFPPCPAWDCRNSRAPCS